jgi:hypothetical protein
MTSIKPPGSSPVDLPTAPHSVDSTEVAGTPSFAAQLEAAREVAGQPQVGGAGDLVSALSRDLQAGKLTWDQAVEALAERAAAGVGKHLDAQQRADLLVVLRTALASDPTLAALRDSVR